jgi:SAM-dependent methyltransferase
VAWRSLGRYRPAYFRPVAGLFARGAPLRDRAEPEIESINDRSRAYFEKAESRAFWLNRPLSDRPADPSFLWRFGLLASAMRIQPGDRILDFGCGAGWTSVLLARMGAEVVGADVAPAALATARRAAERDLKDLPDAKLRFVEYGKGRIDAPDGYFDHVVAFDAFHHLPHPRTVLAEFHRVLGPFGCFAFSEPGIGHTKTDSSRAERAQGVLEEDVDLEPLYRTAREVGFERLDVLIPPLPPDVLSLPYARLRLFLRGMTWLVPPDLLRKEILTRPMGIFGKGPYAVTTLAPRRLGARLSCDTRSICVPAGSVVAISVRAKNLAETVWLRQGRWGKGYVRLGGQLLRPSGEVIDRDWARAPLPSDVREGETVLLTLTAPPPPAGDYRIRLDLVDEGVAWFAERGSEAVEVALLVESVV